MDICGIMDDVLLTFVSWITRRGFAAGDFSRPWVGCNGRESFQAFCPDDGSRDWDRCEYDLSCVGAFRCLSSICPWEAKAMVINTKCSELMDSIKIFSQMVHQNLVSWNPVIAADLRPFSSTEIRICLTPIPIPKLQCNIEKTIRGDMVETAWITHDTDLSYKKKI